MSISIYPQSNVGPSITEEQVRKFENLLERPLPDDYKRYLLHRNGGVMEAKNGSVYFIQSGTGDDYYIFCLFSIDHPKSDCDLGSIWELCQGNFPYHFLAIGDTGGGDLYCISLGDDDYGQIYYWNHEYEPYEPDYENCTLIANSFTEFAGSFRYAE